ncbi:MAG TPA: hypothetical protein VGL06_07815 [Pseudonocardiaceae bacterium]
MSDANLDALLESLTRAQLKGFEYNGFVANHAPMAAEVLATLGLSYADIAKWTETYLTWVDEPEPGQERIVDSPASLAAALGDIERSTDWVAFFDEELKRASWRDVLLSWWPRLLPGVSAAGTHGFLRVAHTVRTITTLGEVNATLLHEIAHGLGYWAARYQELPGAYAGARANRDLDAALAGLPWLPATAKSPREGIPGRFELLSATPDVAPGFAGLVQDVLPARPWSAGIDRLTAIGAHAFIAYQKTPIPFVHLVTAPSALRILDGVLPADLLDATAWHLWQFFAAIFAGFGALTPAKFTDDVAAPTATALWTGAVEHGDEHVLKFTDACLTEYARSGDDVFRRAASVAPSRFGTLKAKPL